MSKLKAKRVSPWSNTWQFNREVLETVTGEDGAPEQVIVEEAVDLFTFKIGITTEDLALAERERLLPELAPGFVLPPTQADYSGAIQRLLDSTAAQRGYDSIQTAVSYRDDPNSQFAAEGQALFEWRSAVWTAATAMLAAVDPASPPPIADIIDALPAFEWPA